MSEGDMRTLKRLGFDHARLSIDPELLIADSKDGKLLPGSMARLDETVSDLIGAGLNVVLDVQPLDGWKKPLASSDESVDRFVAFWGAFATHYAKADTEKVFFEVLNEPLMEDRTRWEEIQSRAVAMIRSVAPRHTIIATAVRYDHVDELLAMEPMDDDNVIYTFHDYDPMWFTHQGAAWGMSGWVALRGVPYPSGPENMEGVAQQEPDELDRLQVERFSAERWDASRIEMEISAVEGWAKLHVVPVYCGEFGVYKEFADPRSRVRWIHDMRSVLESKNIGWAMWDYDGNFGLATKRGDGIVVDQDLLHALGLGE
jgi:endoglucanase